MRIYLVPVVTAVLALGGCAGSGTPIDRERLDEVRRGETTLDQVVARFGKPNFLSRNWDGTQTAAYAYAEGRSDAALTLPALGAALAGTGGGVDSVVFYFDGKGVLQDFKATGSGTRPESPAAGAVASPSRPIEAPHARPADAASAKAPAHSVAGSPPRAPAPDTRKRDADGLPSWLPSSSSRGDRY